MELLFTDEAALLAASEENLQKIVDMFVRVTYGQEVSIKKAEVMLVRGLQHSAIIAPTIIIKAKKLSIVTEFKYVGGTEKNIVTMDREINIIVQNSRVT